MIKIYETKLEAKKNWGYWSIDRVLKVENQTPYVLYITGEIIGNTMKLVIKEEKEK